MPKPRDTKDDRAVPASRDNRRRFLKKAGTIAIAVPVMESLSREGLLVRSAHAQTGEFLLIGPLAGPITPVG